MLIRSKLNLTITILFFFSVLQSGFSQFNVNNGATAMQMAQELVGPGVQVISATYVGDNRSKGIFTAGGTSLPMTNGVVLTSGFVTSIANPAGGPIMSNNATGGGDADLATLVNGGSVVDACYLEFQFKAIGTEINFEFVFGSEEYPTYNCTQYNDVFGFFISGPGIVGKKNLALVPGTNIPVTINTINNGVPGGGGNMSYCTSPGSGSPFTQYYINNSSSSTIEFNGLTTTLVATQTVQSCEIYTLKLAIADVTDFQYDSGVFIKSNSFSTEVPTLTIESDPVFPVCPTETGTFTAHLTNGGSNVSFNWYVNGVLQMGNDSILVLNNLKEGDKIAVISTSEADCNGTKLGAGPIIVSFLPYTHENLNVTICQGESYTFNGVTYTAPTTTPTDTVPNPPGCPKIIHLNLAVTPSIQATMPNFGPFCQGDTPPSLPGNSTNTPPLAGTWSPSTINTSKPGTSAYVFTPNSGQCGLPVTINITVNAPVVPTFTQLGPYCKGSTPGTLPGTSTNIPAITGTWSPATINTSTSGSTTYTFTPGAGQCATTTTMVIVVNEPVLPTFSPIGPLCQNSTAPVLPGSSNNSPAINGTWSPSTINTSTPGTFTFTFTPAAGSCALPTTMSITIDPEITPTFDQLGPYCKDETADILPGSSNNSPAINGTWSPSVINTSTPGSTTYTFTPNAGICATVFTMTIVVETPVVPTFTQLGPYCKDDIPGILNNTSSNNPGITGTWTPSTINTSTPGTFVYTFTPDAGQCADITTMEIVIEPPVIPSFTPIDPLCQNSTPIVLPNPSNDPFTGTWNPTPVNTADVGTSTYTFTPDAGQCALPTTLEIEVVAPVEPAFDPIGPLCQHSSAPTLPSTSNDSPSISGVWSPSTINTSTPGTFTFTFTPNSDECALPVTMEIIIDPELTPTFDQLGPYCKDDVADILSTSSNETPPITGTWSPSTISTSTPGDFTFVFTPDAGICAEEVTMVVTVTTPVIPVFDQLGPYCKDETPDDLPAMSNDNPAITGNWNPAIINTTTPGDYTFTFTPDPGQCADPVTMQIIIEAPVNPTFDPIPDLCLNSPGIILPNTSNDVPPISGSWNPQPVVTFPAGITTYIFTPDGNECALPVNMDITVIDPVITSFTAMGPFCQYSAPATLPSVSNNTPPVSGNWIPSTINTSTPGITTYIFTPNSNECATTFEMEIEILPEIVPIFDQLGPYCMLSTPDVLSEYSQNDPPIHGTWSPATINTGISGPSTYTFTPDAGLCSPVVTMEIVINRPFVPIFNPIGPFCQNMPAPSLPTSSDDVIPVTGTWSPAVINTSQVGTFVYTFTPDAGQCNDPRTISIVIFAPPPPSFTQITPLCQNSTPSVLPTFSNDNPPISGQWSPSTISTGTVGTSTYTFTPDAGQCASNTSMTIEILAPVLPVFDQLGPFCNGITPPELPVISNNIPGFTGSWDPPTINTSTSGSTLYTFTPNQNHCATMATMSIEVLALPEISITPVAPLCIDSAAVTLSATPAGGSWSGTNVTGNIFDPLDGGQFSVFYTYTDANNCTNVSSIDITVNDCSCMNPASADAGPDGSICIGGVYNLSGQIWISSTSTWTSSGTGTFGNTANPITTYTPSAADIAAGSVILTLRANDPDGIGPCSATSDQMLLLITNTPVNIVPVQPICSNLQSFELFATPSGGIWSGTGVLGNYFDPATSGPGTHTVTYTLTGGCIGASSIDIVVYDAPVVSLLPIGQLCMDDPAVFLVATPSGGTFIGQGMTGNVFTPSIPGIFKIDYLYTDANLCTSIASIDINVVNCNCINPTTADAGADGTFCPTGAQPISGIITNTSSSIWSSSGNGTFGNVNNLNTTYTPGAADIAAGSFTLTLTALDPDGEGPCLPASDQVTFTLNIVEVDISPVDPKCINDPIITLSATPSGGIFSGNGISGLTFNPALAGQGSHIITYTTSGNCPTSKAITIVVNPLPVINIDFVPDLCLNDPAITLSAAPSGGQFSGANVNNGVFTPSTVGNFTISYEYSDANGCKNQASITVNVTDCSCENPAGANAGPNAIVCSGNNYQLFGSITVATSATWTTSGTGTFDNENNLNAIYSPSAADIISGSVILTLTTSDPDGNGPCSPVSDDVQLTFEELNIIITEVGPLCIDAGNMTLSATPSGGNWSGPGVSGNIFNPTLAGPGAHLITYAIAGNCNGTENIEIVVNPLPVINFNAVPDLCIDDPSIVLSATPSSGTFSGSHVSGNTFTPSASGTFTITYDYTDSNSCQSSAQIDILVNDCGCENPATVNAGADVTICGSSTFELDGIIGVATSATWTTNGDGVFNDINDLQSTYTPGVNDISNGSVILTLTTSDPDGIGPCHIATDQIVLTLESIDINISAVSSQCIDADAITLFATPAGGTFSGNGVNGNGFNPQDAGIGSHVITYTVNGTCLSSEQITIIVTALPTINIDPVSPLCIEDPAVQLIAQPAGGTFSGTNVNGGIFNPLNAGTFTITYNYTDTNGCSNSATLDITVEDCGCENPASASAGADINACAGETIQLNGIITVAVNAFWSTSGTGTFNNAGNLNAIYTPSAADITAGTITLTLTTSDPDGNGPCHAASDMILINISEPIVSISPVNALCINGSPVTLNGNPAGGIFGGNGVIGNIFDPVTAGVGNHVITYNSGGNCPGSATITINVVNLPVVNINPVPALCIDDAAITLIGTPSGGIFSGQGLTNNVFNPVQAGNFSITYTYTNSAGCTNFAQIEITVNDCGCPDPATASAGPDAIICAGQSYDLSGSSNGAVQWTTSGSGIFTNPNNVNTSYIPGATDIAAGNVILTITTLDPDGNGPCHSFSDALKLTIIDVPIAKINTLSTSLCLDDNKITLSGSPSGGIWTGNGVNGSDFDPFIAGLGNHIIIYTIQSGDCISKDSVIITVEDCGCNTPVIVNAGPDINICEGNKILLNAQVTGTTQVTWSTSGSGSFTNTNQAATEYIPSAQDKLNQNIILTITTNDPDGDGPCISKQDYLAVNITTLIKVDLLIENTDCSQSTGSVTVLPPASDFLVFSVDNGGTFSDLPVFDGLKPGSYTLIYKEPISGCNSSIDFNINPPPFVAADWKLTSKACSDALTNYLDVISTDNMTLPIDIYVDDQLLTTATSVPVKIDNLSIGEHSLMIIDSKGCEVIDDFTITETSNIDISIQGVYVVDEGESLVLTPNISGPYSTILWTPSDYLSCTTCPNPTTRPLEPITYSVEVTNEQGCKDEIDIRIVLRKKVDIFVPNIFSPNGDGVNDLVNVFTDDNIKIIRNFKIFSRWGELVFEKSDMLPNTVSEGWNGKFRGENMNPAVFAWVMEVDIPGEGIRIMKGDITLIR